MQALYQQAIKDHNTYPTGLDNPIDISHSAEGYNASCGDEITFHLNIAKANTQIINISFSCDCCAICKASASILCKISQGQSVQFLQQQAINFEQYLTDAVETSGQLLHQELNCLFAVKQHISRINCALLPWQTALQACNSPRQQPSSV